MNYGFNDYFEKVEIIPKADVVVLTGEVKSVGIGAVGNWEFTVSNLSNYVPISVIVGDGSTIGSGTIYTNYVVHDTRPYPGLTISNSSNKVNVYQYNDAETAINYWCKVVLLKVS